MWVKVKETRVLSFEKEYSGILLKELNGHIRDATCGILFFFILLINRQRSSTKKYILFPSHYRRIIFYLKHSHIHISNRILLVYSGLLSADYSLHSYVIGLSSSSKYVRHGK